VSVVKAMHSLTAITALGASDPRIETIEQITCSEVPEVSLASVTARLGKESQTRTALKKALGTDAPDVQKVSHKKITAFWVAPDQWMIEAPFESHEGLAAQLKTALKANASVVEQTDAWTRFDVTGEAVVNAMELLCALNTRGMAVDDVSRTSIHHLGCFVRRISADHFALYGPRASAGSLHHAIVTAMSSVR
jgi:sarcosine oxidase subunit gamma